MQQVFNVEAGDAVDLFEIQPFNHSSGSAADSLVDLVRPSSSVEEAWPVVLREGLGVVVCATF